MESMQPDKSAPPAKIAVALLLIVTIVGAIVFSLSTLTDEIEEHYHIFHPQAKKVDDHGKSGSNLIFLIALYPILSVIGLLLVIPLLMYITDHSPFQRLNLLNPFHFAKLLKMVYTAWSQAENGKMKSKDM